MRKKRVIATWAVLLSLMLTASGCALISTAISAGIAYGIYKASE